MRFRSIVARRIGTGRWAASALYLSRRPRPRADEPEQEKPVVPPSPEPRPSLRLPLPYRGRRSSELQPALDRVFDQTLDRGPAERAGFVAGDFNGDDVADLAVAARPRDRRALARLNADFARWSVQDAAWDVSAGSEARAGAGGGR